MKREISNSDDIIDSRDVIETLEDLEGVLQDQYDTYAQEMMDEHEAALEEYEEMCDGGTGPGIPAPVAEKPVSFEQWLMATAINPTHLYEAEAQEFIFLRELARQAEGYGDWAHGEALIRESYFQQYAEQLAEDIGAINRDAAWPLSHIDWEAAAKELKFDYVEVDYGGVAYQMRA